MKRGHIYKLTSQLLDRSGPRADSVKILKFLNLKNQECQQRFKNYTSNTKMLSIVFDSNEDIEVLTNRFMKNLKDV